MVQPVFAIELNIRDSELINRIHSYFGAGILVINKSKNSIAFSVQSTKILKKVIIPHFDKYPLLTQKRADFELFKLAVELISRKEHLTIEGLRKIVAIRASMNKGLTDTLKDAFPGIIPVQRPTIDYQGIPDPYWLVGFTEAEGCFLVRIQNSLAYKSGSQVKLVFTLGQHSRDSNLFKGLIEYLGCGNYYVESDGLLCYFVVTKYVDISEKVVPLFAKYPLEGSKLQNYLDFVKVVELMKEKTHLTEEGVTLIRKIKSGMNTGRDYS